MLEVVKRDGVECLCPRHKPTGTVRSRAVPVVVALADADKAAVAHIHRDDDLFTSHRRNRTLADYAVPSIDIVVQGLEPFVVLQRLSLEILRDDDVGNGKPVQVSKLRTDVGIVQIVGHILAVEVALVIGNVAFHSFALQPAQSLLDFVPPSLTLVLADYALAFLVELLLAVA